MEPFLSPDSKAVRPSFVQILEQAAAVPQGRSEGPVPRRVAQARGPALGCSSFCGGGQGSVYSKPSAQAEAGARRPGSRPLTHPTPPAGASRGAFFS